MQDVRTPVIAALGVVLSEAVAAPVVVGLHGRDRATPADRSDPEAGLPPAEVAAGSLGIELAGEEQVQPSGLALIDDDALPGALDELPAGESLDRRSVVGLGRDHPRHARLLLENTAIGCRVTGAGLELRIGWPRRPGDAGHGDGSGHRRTSCQGEHAPPSCLELHVDPFDEAL